MFTSLNFYLRRNPRQRAARARAEAAVEALHPEDGNDDTNYQEIEKEVAPPIQTAIEAPSIQTEVEALARNRLSIGPLMRTQ